MTVAEIVQRAETLLKSRPGYHFSSEKIAAKAEQGLVASDAVQQGDIRIVYVNATTVRKEQRVNGKWQQVAELPAGPAQLDALLVQVAAQAGQLSSFVG